MSIADSGALTRLFFALWPDAATRARLVETRDSLQGIRANWIAPEKLHVTLAFLGQVPVERLPEVTSAADGVSSEVFDLVFDRVEVWRRTQVLCLTPSTPGDGVFDLVTVLLGNLKQSGFKPDARRYRPHLTLARRVRLRTLSGDAAVKPLHWPAHAFCLVESSQAWGGSQYVVKKTWPLMRQGKIVRSFD